MLRFFFPKGDVDNEISRLDQEIRNTRKEIRRLEKQSRRLRAMAAPAPEGARFGRKKGGKQIPEEDRRRLVSYLGAGSVQTIRQYKFKSDLLRKRRMLLAAAVLIAIALIVAALYLI